MASSMRRSDQPSRPSASTCCFFSSPKTLVIPAVEHVHTASSTSRAAYLLVAGFQVSISGRFWVSTEVAAPIPIPGTRPQLLSPGGGPAKSDVGGDSRRAEA